MTDWDTGLTVVSEMKTTIMLIIAIDEVDVQVIKKFRQTSTYLKLVTLITHY